MASQSRASDSPSPGECRDSTNGPARRRRRQELVFKYRYPAGLGVARQLFLTKQEHQFPEVGFECGEASLAILEARVEFAFAQGEQVGADFEVGLGTEDGARFAAQFLLGTAAGFVERLHPESFRHMRDRFR